MLVSRWCQTCQAKKLSLFFRISVFFLIFRIFGFMAESNQAKLLSSSLVLILALLTRNHRSTFCSHETTGQHFAHSKAEVNIDCWYAVHISNLIEHNPYNIQWIIIAWAVSFSPLKTTHTQREICILVAWEGLCCPFLQWQLLQKKETFLFLATLVALHLTPVSKWVSEWVIHSFGLA